MSPPVILRAVLWSALFWTVPIALANAQSPSNSPPVPKGRSGILQLISALQPIDSNVEVEVVPTPAPESMQPTRSTRLSTDLQGMHAYPVGPSTAPGPYDWTAWFPTGMVPICGPRTPLSQRYGGWGGQLDGTSWLNRPYSAGWFAGVELGAPAMHGVDQKAGFFGGYRLGWDYDYFWGLEARIGAANLGLAESGLSQPLGTSDTWLLDTSLHYYPWGDSLWRPFVSGGFGLAGFQFNNTHTRINQTLVGMPIGLGIKYLWRPWFVLRGDIMDNVAFGNSQLNTMNNVSLTAGVDIRFGGHRPSYWPWHSSRQVW